MLAAEDPFNLQRFVDAQANGVYEQALAELRRGRKESHWMWFIFPQSAELGRSETAKYYGLSGEEEARAYLAHPLLGPRYRECVAAVRAWVDAGPSADADFVPTSSGQARLEAIFGELDAMKFRSRLNPPSARSGCKGCLHHPLLSGNSDSGQPPVGTKRSPPSR